jgi:hypothetical protein
VHGVPRERDLRDPETVTDHQDDGARPFGAAAGHGNR